MPYVYKHIRLDTNEIFYIGIGSDKKHLRAYSQRGRNKMWKEIVKKTQYAMKQYWKNKRDQINVTN